MEDEVVRCQLDVDARILDMLTEKYQETGVPQESLLLGMLYAGTHVTLQLAHRDEDAAYVASVLLELARATGGRPRVYAMNAELLNPE